LKKVEKHSSISSALGLGKGKAIAGVTSQFIIAVIVAEFGSFSFKQTYSFIRIVKSLIVTKLLSKTGLVKSLSDFET